MNELNKYIKYYNKNKDEELCSVDDALINLANKSIERAIKFLLMDTRARSKLSFFLKGVLNVDICLYDNQRIISSIEPTAATDGSHIYFNPALLELCSKDDIVFLFAHEILHNCLDHIYRGKGKNHNIWNIATDFVVNNILLSTDIKKINVKYYVKGIEQEFKPIIKLNIDGKIIEFNGQSEEEIYNLLINSIKNKQDMANAVMCQSVIDDLVEQDVLKPSTKSQQEVRDGWSVFNHQHKDDYDKTFGKESLGYDALLKQENIERLNWRDEIANFLLNNIRRTDWSRPNRRCNGTIVYNPRKYSVSKKKILIATDSSGSISDKDMGEFLSYTIDILNQTNLDATLIKFDTKISSSIEIDKSGYDINELLKRDCGGGTDFDCVFKFIIDREDEYGGMIIFSDMEANIDKLYETYDEVPSLFVSNNNNVRIKVPGRIIYV